MSTPTPTSDVDRQSTSASTVPGAPEWFNATTWLLHRNAATDPGRPALVAVEPGAPPRTVTYGDLEQLVRRTAAALLAAGVRAEERMLISMADTPELVAVFLAGLYIGAVPVPVNTMLTGKDLAVLAEDSRARLLAVTSEFAEAAVAPASSPYLSDVVVVGADALPARVAARVRSWDRFLADAGDDAKRAADRPYPTVADSPGFWLYTSGTTGTPKAAMHRHGSLRSTAETYARDVLDIRPDDVCFSVAKFFFAYGLGNSLTFPLSVGASAILDRARATPLGAAEILRRHQPTLFFGVPVVYNGLLQADVPADTFARVRLCLSAGEAMPAELCRRFMDRYGVELLDGIGSTEALHIFLSNRAGRVRPGTTGQPVAGYELRLEDDDGNPVPDGEPGNLYVRGDSIATGYWCRTEMTRRVFRGPWLRTGDTYVRDAEGYYTAMGRSDDVLKAGGIWVSPSEVENRLAQHAAVAQVAVVGVPDADGLDKPVACVVLRPGRTAGAEELIAFCRTGLAVFKRPREVLIIDELPLTATGKVQRFKVKEIAMARLAGRSSSESGAQARTAGSAPAPTTA